MQIFPIRDPDYADYIKKDGSVPFDCEYLYFRGDADTDGSIRWHITEGSVVFEFRISGSWTPVMGWP